MSPSAAAMRAAEKAARLAPHATIQEIAAAIDAEFAPLADAERAELVRRLRDAAPADRFDGLARLLLEASDALSRPAPGWDEELKRLKDRIDTRLNDCLCEMEPDYDDSIVGFNEAWDIVRKVFADTMKKEPGK